MRRLAACAALLLLTLPGAVPGEKKTNEPFYRRFLVAGDPLDEAILMQERRLEEDPDNAALHNDMGVLLARRRFPEMACDEFRRAMKLDKKNWIAPYNLGLVLETEVQDSKAISAYRESIDRHPGFPPSHFRLGRLYEKTRRIDDAVQEYAIAFRIDPSMRNPEINPLVIDSQVMDRVAIVNAAHDAGRAQLSQAAVYAEPERFQPPPVDRPLTTDELIDPAAPPTVPIRISSDAAVAVPDSVTPPPPALTPIPSASASPGAFGNGRPRTTRRPLSPDAFAGRPTPPPPQPEPDPEPETEEEPEPEPTVVPGRR